MVRTSAMVDLQTQDEGTPRLDVIQGRILEVTIELATSGGYEAVRQRDVATGAGVALATVYARFASKDALLAAALEMDSRIWVEDVRKLPLRGRTPLTRVTRLFEHLTRALLHRPHLARAGLRATTSGDHEAMLNQIVAQDRINTLVADTLRGNGPTPPLSYETARRVAVVLSMVWFSGLTAWSARVGDEAMVVDMVKQAADMLLHGAQRL